MRTIMHHIESNGRRYATKKDAFQYAPNRSRCEEYEMYIDGRQRGDQQYGFEEEFKIAGRGLALLAKVFGDPLFEFCVKG
jgi:hypothetical protein